MIIKPQSTTNSEILKVFVLHGLTKITNYHTNWWVAAITCSCCKPPKSNSYTLLHWDDLAKDSTLVRISQPLFMVKVPNNTIPPVLTSRPHPHVPMNAGSGNHSRACPGSNYCSFSVPSKSKSSKDYARLIICDHLFTSALMIKFLCTYAQHFKLQIQVMV